MNLRKEADLFPLKFNKVGEISPGLSLLLPTADSCPMDGKLLSARVTLHLQQERQAVLPRDRLTLRQGPNRSWQPSPV